ncbi:MAG: hypothetical protein ACFFDN_48175 [Candidatus Hodarchaeota archaeon]
MKFSIIRYFTLFFTILGVVHFIFFWSCDKDNPSSSSPTAYDRVKSSIDEEIHWRKAINIHNKKWPDSTIFFQKWDYPDPFIVPAIVLFSYDKPQILEEINGIPEQYLPQNDDEVRTVIFLFKNREEYGTYSPVFLTAYRWEWILHIVDLQEEILWYRSFYGGNPPSSVDSNADIDERTGSPPKSACINWIINSIKK